MIRYYYRQELIGIAFCKGSVYFHCPALSDFFTILNLVWKLDFGFPTVNLAAYAQFSFFLNFVVFSTCSEFRVIVVPIASYLKSISMALNDSICSPQTVFPEEIINPFTLITVHCIPSVSKWECLCRVNLGLVEENGVVLAKYGKQFSAWGISSSCKCYTWL